MGLDGSGRDKKSVSDLLVRQAQGDQFEDLVFAFAYARLLDPGFFNRGVMCFSRYGRQDSQPPSCPDAQAREYHGNDSDVGLEREYTEEVVIFDVFKNAEQYR